MNTKGLILRAREIISQARVRLWRRKHNKIFCIGLNKTGTSSLHTAFGILGFKSAHFKCDEGNIKTIITDNYRHYNRKLLTGIEHYDCISDWNNPAINLLFKQLDREHPNSKFILNTRDMNRWIESRKKHILRIPNLEELRNEMPENDYYNLNISSWITEYEQLHCEVIEYFENRGCDLLVFNIEEGDGWNELCRFLSLPTPKCNFPHSNKAKNTRC